MISYILFLVFLLSQPWRSKGCFLNEKHILTEKFHGVVVEKFIDYPNHATETIKLKSGQKISLRRGEKYYQIIEVGDSISKIYNTFILEVYKKDSLVILTYKMPCWEEGFLHH